MRSIWLLPDREQAGFVQAIENGKTSAVHELINVTDLPPEFILGIPEEVFRSKPEELFLFAQYAKLKSGSGVFCLSAPTGEDISGRTVATSNLQLLEAGEMPNLKPSTPKGISGQDQDWIQKIILADEIGNPELLKPIYIMLDAMKTNQSTRSFSSEPLLLARNKPEWMPKKKVLQNIINKHTK